MREDVTKANTTRSFMKSQLHRSRAEISRLSAAKDFAEGSLKAITEAKGALSNQVSKRLKTLSSQIGEVFTNASKEESALLKELMEQVNIF